MMSTDFDAAYLLPLSACPSTFLFAPSHKTLTVTHNLKTRLPSPTGRSSSTPAAPCDQSPPPAPATSSAQAAPSASAHRRPTWSERRYCCNGGTASTACGKHGSRIPGRHVRVQCDPQLSERPLPETLPTPAMLTLQVSGNPIFRVLERRAAIPERILCIERRCQPVCVMVVVLNQLEMRVTHARRLQPGPLHERLSLPSAARRIEGRQESQA